MYALLLALFAAALAAAAPAPADADVPRLLPGLLMAPVAIIEPVRPRGARPGLVVQP